MSTVSEQDLQTGKGTRLVEMAWDPITRIIGNLGIYTKIDFANRKVVECKSTSSMFRGYSVFMAKKASGVHKSDVVNDFHRFLATRSETVNPSLLAAGGRSTPPSRL